MCYFGKFDYTSIYYTTLAQRMNILSQVYKIFHNASACINWCIEVVFYWSQKIVAANIF